MEGPEFDRPLPMLAAIVTFVTGLAVASALIGAAALAFAWLL